MFIELKYLKVNFSLSLSMCLRYCSITFAVLGLECAENGMKIVLCHFYAKEFNIVR